MRISFFGAAGTVTGSKFLVETQQIKILIDCGLFQGLKELRLKNWQKLPFTPSDIDAIVLTHAHIDHSGYIPIMVRDGFKGSIYCSPPTKDLCSILLPDCGRIAEEDAEYANRKGFSKHKPALPLYTEKDALKAMSRFKSHPVQEKLKLGDLQIEFEPVGHILGATSVRVKHGSHIAVFSGDIGRYEDLLENEPQASSGGHWVIMESTYGDRVHAKTNPVIEMAKIVNQIVEKKSVLVIPSFAVGRAQILLYCLYQALKKGLIPKIPIYVNSPMASKVTNLYNQYHQWHRLNEEESQATFSIAKFISSVEESKALNNKTGPMIIISASGMLTGGRVLHHIKEFGPKEDNVILLPGYQAQGTRGCSLASNATSLKIHGEYIPINAKIYHWDILSAHADQNALLKWLKDCKMPPKKVFIVHGDPQASDNLRRLVEESMLIPVVIPHYGSSYNLA